MEFLRSAYSAEFKFYGDSDFLTPVDWYFVRDNAKALPIAHNFGSQIYDLDEAPMPVGEQPEPRPWRGGQPPGPVAGWAKDCKDETFDVNLWMNGAFIGDPLPDVYPGTNVPVTCCPPSQMPFGGAAIGGRIVGPSPPPAIGGLAVGGEFRGPLPGPPIGGLAVGGEFRGPLPGPPIGGLAVGGGFTAMRSEIPIGGTAVGGRWYGPSPTPRVGGGGTGGSFTKTSPPSSPCAVGGTKPVPLYVTWEWQADNCNDLDGRSETLTTSTCVIQPDNAAWAEGSTFTAFGFNFRLLITCHTTLHEPVIALIDPSCTAVYLNAYMVDVVSTSPLVITCIIDMTDFCPDGFSTYLVTISDTP